jgi:hypothetical protein
MESSMSAAVSSKSFFEIGSTISVDEWTAANVGLVLLR